MVVSDNTVKFKGYKCFKDEFAGFDKIMPINIIIGKNNSGKSSLIDLIRFVINFKKGNKDIPDQVCFKLEKEVTESILKTAFNEYKSEGRLGGNHWHQHGTHIMGIRWLSELDKNFKLIKEGWKDEEFFSRNDPNKKAEIRKHQLLQSMQSIENTEFRKPTFFNDKMLKNILSERDIVPEIHINDSNNNNIAIQPNGVFCTNMVQRYLVNAELDRELMRTKLRDALNEIFEPDSSFNEILVRRLESSDKFEIFFDESETGLVPLSKSGSGLKTIIQVLLNLLIVPESEGKKVSNYLFAFEELENNLHPALLRRLFSYIEDFARKNDCHFFITTHSPVVIDKFSTCDIAQIIHVTHDGKTARTKTIESFTDKNSLLDDIGAKASDLMQANGIVWLEGPSDRIYFNKWIDLISDGKIKEHKDYECAFFGGSILKHYEANPEPSDNAVNILKVNRNAILVCDGDKTSEKNELKARVKKIQDEAKDVSLFMWITAAKEIENYIPASILEKIFDKTNLPEIEKHQHFYHVAKSKKGIAGYWNKHKFKGKYDKVDLAHKVVDSLNSDHMQDRFDWKIKMTEVIDNIKKWNFER